jgi:hypothetical protein
MFHFSALAFGLLLLTFASQVCAAESVKVMPFGASIVSVSSLLLCLFKPHN